MVRVYVMYPYSDGCRFDFDYYARTHMALTRRLLGPFGLRGTFVGRGIDGGGPGVPPQYVCVGGMEFNSQADYHRGVKRHGTELQADFINYTDIKPILVVTETEHAPLAAGAAAAR